MMGGTPGCPAAGDGCESRTRSTVGACLRACVSIRLAGSLSVSQSVLPKAPRGKMAGHDPSLGSIDGCTWSPPLPRYCG